jgi:hypothetical protein
MVNNTKIIYESLEGSRPTFRWCWRVHELDSGLVYPSQESGDPHTLGATFTM